MGGDRDAAWERRMAGDGAYAETIAKQSGRVKQRFGLAAPPVLVKA